MKHSALLVGINKYKDAPLNGCVNDVLLAQKILESKGFKTKILLDENASRNNILEGLETLLSSNCGNLVFHYSGHGSQVPDKSGDEKDGLDECILPYDYKWDSVILDDDFDSLFGKYKVPHVEVILDACHSGSGTRSVLFSGDISKYTERFIRPPMELFDYISNPDKCAAKPLRLKNVVTWSGCRDDQTSADAKTNGNYNGIFSYAFYNNMVGSRYCILKNTQKFIANRAFSQVPQLTCKFNQNGSQPFFNDKSLFESLLAKLRC